MRIFSDLRSRTSSIQRRTEAAKNSIVHLLPPGFTAETAYEGRRAFGIPKDDPASPTSGFVHIVSPEGRVAIVVHIFLRHKPRVLYDTVEDGELAHRIGAVLRRNAFYAFAPKVYHFRIDARVSGNGSALDA
jgi:hypothetical protein